MRKGPHMEPEAPVPKSTGQPEQFVVRTVDLLIHPEWDQRATLLLNKGLPDEFQTGSYFSKAQLNRTIDHNLETGVVLREVAERLKKEVAESNLPERFDNLSFIECGHCQGHGWLVSEKYDNMPVRSKSEARAKVALAPTDLDLTDEDRKKILDQIEASSMSEKEDPLDDLARLFGGSIVLPR